MVPDDGTQTARLATTVIIPARPRPSRLSLKTTQPSIPKETTMQYKTMILELLQQRPEMHDQLRKERKLLTTMERYARELKTSHEAWKELLSQLQAGQRQEPDRERRRWRWPSRNWRIVCPPRLRRTRASAIPRRSNGVHPPSYAARVKASRRQPTLFDPPPLFRPAYPAPPGPKRRHVINPPGRQATIGSPEGLPNAAGPSTLAHPAWG